MAIARVNRRLLAPAIILALPVGAAQAATQGTLGATSTGTVTVSASVPNRVQITALSDVAFTNADPTSAASNSQSICVWSNTGTKGYNVMATGSGAGSAFTLASGALPVVPYTVQWSQSSGQTSGTALTKSVALPGQVSTATSAACTAAPTTTASLVVGMAAADLQTMVSSTSYTGTLTLVIAPE